MNRVDLIDGGSDRHNKGRNGTRNGLSIIQRSAGWFPLWGRGARASGARRFPLTQLQVYLNGLPPFTFIYPQGQVHYLANAVRLVGCRMSTPSPSRRGGRLRRACDFCQQKKVRG